MGLFSKKQPKTWIGRYIAHVGSIGILALIFGIFLSIGFIGNVVNFFTLNTVQAEIIDFRDECSLVWQQEGDRKSQPAESCEEAENTKNTSTERLFKVDRTRFAIVEWIGPDGKNHKRELSQSVSLRIDHLTIGDSTKIAVGSGDNPRVGSHETLSSLGITAGILVLLAAFAWPPAKNANKRPPFLYLKGSNKGGKIGEAASGFRAFLARWSFHGVTFGLTVMAMGAWFSFSSSGDDIEYINTNAEITEIENHCRLSPVDGGLLKFELTQKLPCAQARAIAESRSEEQYKIAEITDYHLKYDHPKKGEQEKVSSASFLNVRSLSVGDQIPIKVATDNPNRLIVLRLENEKLKDTGKSINIYHFMIFAGAAATVLSVIILLILGVKVNWSRFSRFKKPG